MQITLSRYRLMLRFLWPVFTVLWWIRRLRQPSYRLNWNERWGHYQQAVSGPVIWLHAVSVGETRAAIPLLKRLLDAYPEVTLVLTHMTATGKNTALESIPTDIVRVYLPYDWPSAVQRFLQHFKPNIGLIMETEVWPSVVAECVALRIPICLINGRLSEHSLKNYLKAQPLIGDSLNSLTLLLAQTEADKRRYAKLTHQNIFVTGNIKFDALIPPQQKQLSNTFKLIWGHRSRVWLLASSRDGEEKIFLDSYQYWLGSKDDLLIIVPRHPERFDEVANLIERAGLTYQRRSAGLNDMVNTQVLLGDSMGELYAYYLTVTGAIMGGTWLPFGGQNLIEACRAGCPVVFGPHTENFKDISQQARLAGAALYAATIPELMNIMTDWSIHPNQLTKIREAGKTFIQTHQGATDRCMKLISPILQKVLQKSTSPL